MKNPSVKTKNATPASEQSRSRRLLYPHDASFQTQLFNKFKNKKGQMFRKICETSAPKCLARGSFPVPRAKNGFGGVIGTRSMCERIPVAVPEIFCSLLLTKFRPLPLLFAPFLRHRRRSQTSPVAVPKASANIAPSRRIVARLRKTGLARRAPCFGDFVRQKRYAIVFGSSPNEPARRTHNPRGCAARIAPRAAKRKKGTRLGAFSAFGLCDRFRCTLFKGQKIKIAIHYP